MDSALIGLCGPSIWFAHHKVQRPLLRLTVIVPLVIICVIVFLVEGQRFEQQIYAYVVLSFESSGSEEDKVLLDLSRAYRSILEEAFKSATTSVRIMPEKFDTTNFEAFSIRHSSRKAVMIKLRQSRFAPKIIIRSYANIRDGKIVCIVSHLNRLINNDIQEMGPPLSGGGTRDDLSYILLRTTFDLILQLKKRQDFSHISQHELDIKKGVLRIYRSFLELRKDKIAPSVLATLKQHLESSGDVQEEDIQQLLQAYPGSLCTSESNPKDAAVRDTNMMKVLINL